jgi:peptide chain release factor 2
VSSRCGGIFDYDNKAKRVAELDKETAKPDFWDNQEKAKTVIAENNSLKEWIEPLNKITKDIATVNDLIQLAHTENSAEMDAEIAKEIVSTEKEMEELELRRMLGGQNDVNNAFLSVNAGAGGTEACDWADMLTRMYKRWTDIHKFSITLIDLLAGDAAGIKSATMLIKGKFAYGYLKAEKGVHRLVRISPYDANKRRHTSFASVDVAPEIQDDIAIEIKDADIRVDTYRSGGAGGQHVNVTDSAVRITHIPSGLVVQCQNERSQHKNRDFAMKVLRARLYELQLRKREEELMREHGLKKKIEWGSQIRSYVFQPYTMVKDHRTGTETSNVQAVMDGEIDDFITSYLKEFSTV